MRISTRLGRRSRISMGPVGWLIFGWLALPAVICWWALAALVQIIIWACRTVAQMAASRRQRPLPPGWQPPRPVPMSAEAAAAYPEESHEGKHIIGYDEDEF